MSGITILLFLGTLGSGAGLETPNPRKLESEAVARRKALLRGEIEIASEGWYARHGSRAKTPYALTARVDFDHKKIRSRVVSPAVGPGSDDRAPAGATVICYGDAVHIWYSDVPAQDGTRSLMNVTDLDVLRETAMTRIADPRMLGIIPESYSNLVHHGWESLVGSDSYKSIAIDRENYAGDDCWKVTKVLLNDVTVRSWFSPKRLNSIVRTESLSEHDQQSIIHRVESDLEYDEPGKLWFPTRCRYEFTVDGAIQGEEVTKVHVIQFGRSVNPKSFTLEGLGIPAGTGIQRIPSDRSGAVHWNGRQIVSTRTPRERVTRLERWDAGRLLWVASTLGLSITSAICVWLLIRQRRSL